MTVDFLYALAAEIVVVTHLVVVVFILLGGFLVWRWNWIGWVHVPIVLWGTFIHFTGWLCPLTPLENFLRAKAGQAGYEGSFVEHYILALLSWDGRTYAMQVLIGILVLAANCVPYGLLFFRLGLVRNRLSSFSDRVRVP
jgi:hypothetical protein